MQTVFSTSYRTWPKLTIHLHSDTYLPSLVHFFAVVFISFPRESGTLPELLMQFALRYCRSWTGRFRSQYLKAGVRAMATAYTSETRGSEYTFDYRVYFSK